MSKIKDDIMQMTSQTGTMNLPKLPQREKKRLLQAEVNFDLFTEVNKEMKARGLTIRQVMEFGLKAFLLASNPKTASRAGIKADS